MNTDIIQKLIDNFYIESKNKNSFNLYPDDDKTTTIVDFNQTESDYIFTFKHKKFNYSRDYTISKSEVSDVDSLFEKLLHILSVDIKKSFEMNHTEIDNSLPSDVKEKIGDLMLDEMIVRSIRDIDIFMTILRDYLKKS